MSKWCAVCSMMWCIKAANFEIERQVHRSGHKRLRLRPSGALVMPRHLHVCVVHIHHKTNHRHPEEERHHYAHQQHQRNGLLGGDGRPRHESYPSDAKCGDQQAIFGEDGAACGHVLLIGEHHLVPPNFDHVIQARRPAAAVDAVAQFLEGRQSFKLFRCVGGPHKVKTFEVGVAMVHHVVANVPQAVSGERRQKGDAPQPFVEIRGVA